MADIIDEKKVQNEYIGHRLTWDEAVSLFPYKWVVFRDYTRHHATFIDGKLEAVLGDDEVTDYELAHLGDDLYISRTADGMASLEQFRGMFKKLM